MKQKDILLLIISSFILVILWIIFSIYHNSVTSTIPEAVSIQILPINPTFDKNTIESIKRRTGVAPIYENATASATTTSAASATTGAVIKP